MKLAVVSDKDNRVIYLRPLPRPSKHGDRLTPVTKVISEKSGDALYRIAGTAVSVEVACVRRDLLKLNTYHVEFELSTLTVDSCCYKVQQGVSIKLLCGGALYPHHCRLINQFKDIKSTTISKSS